MTEARQGRQAIVVDHLHDDPEGRLARQAIIASHLYPSTEIDARLGAIRLVVAVSRGLHGWDIIQRDRGTH